jgi:hypothetical protein
LDEGEVYDGKRLRYTDQLINELEEAIEGISLTPQHDQEGIQLTQDQPILDGEVETGVEDLSDQAEDVEMQENEPESLPSWEAAMYPTPDASICYLQNTDISVPVSSEGVMKVDANFITADLAFGENDLGLPDPPDIEPAIIQELKRQQEERFFDFYQHRVPQAWQSAFHAAVTNQHRRDLPAPPENYRQLRNHPSEKRFREAMEQHK